MFIDRKWKKFEQVRESFLNVKKKKIKRWSGGGGGGVSFCKIPISSI